MKIDDSSYNKLKLFHHFCELIWFIDKHALADAKKAGDTDCVAMLDGIKRDLEKHLEALKKSLCCCSEIFKCSCK